MLLIVHCSATMVAGFVIFVVFSWNQSLHFFVCGILTECFALDMREAEIMKKKIVETDKLNLNHHPQKEMK